MEQPLRRQVVISASTTVLAAALNKALSELNWSFLVSVFVGVLVLLRSYPRCKQWYRTLDRGRRIGVSFLASASASLAALAGWYHIVGPRLSQWIIPDEEVVALVRRARWITYGPLEFDPTAQRQPRPSSMREELLWIRRAGFDGIITFSSQEPLDMIPHLAKESGLSVIMGIWNPTDRREVLLAAAKRKDVDGYVVGHNRLGINYSYRELLNVVRELRLRTRRPVTTTERIGTYLHDQRLLAVGDWVFPDAHLSLRDASQTLPIPIFRADARRDIVATTEYAQKIAALARQHRKPVLLKMITYPMGGVDDTSLHEQANYFSLLLDSRRDAVAEMPLDVSISVHSAFDHPWKMRWPFYQWDPYTGLIDEKGRPRPAAEAVIERLP